MIDGRTVTSSVGRIRTPVRANDRKKASYLRNYPAGDIVLPDTARQDDHGSQIVVPSHHLAGASRITLGVEELRSDCSGQKRRMTSQIRARALHTLSRAAHSPRRDLPFASKLGGGLSESQQVSPEKSPPKIYSQRWKLERAR
ncbi:unnamed protein product [Larinioides sclopetarius]|uniref:Uncharacterized protein n=1 Tax=Larinioides sclopetarius TaxID=280406 RepID=A0AAV2B3M9_9ARAC